MAFFKIDMREEEMYHLAASRNNADNGKPTKERLLDSGITLADGVSPFGTEYHLAGKEKLQFFKEYNSANFKWRQIETDWLESAASIALV